MRNSVMSSTLGEHTASKNASAGLHVMAKPIGPICNLDCVYCYYLEKERLYPGANWRMAGPTLDLFIRQYIEAQPPAAEEIIFAWQGGEPTLLEPGFFEEVVALQQRYMPPGKRCLNTLQTNGVRLDDRWCELFKTHGFLVGISLDGPAELHDHYRVDKQGRPTFEAAWRRTPALATPPGGLQRAGCGPPAQRRPRPPRVPVF